MDRVSTRTEDEFVKLPGIKTPIRVRKPLPQTDANNWERLNAMLSAGQSPEGLLLGQLALMQQYGTVSPSTIAGPIRFPPVKFTDGAFIEEATVNEFFNDPSNLSGYTYSGNPATPAWLDGITGAPCLLTIVPSVPIAGNTPGSAFVINSIYGTRTALGYDGEPLEVVAGAQYTFSIYVWQRNPTSTAVTLNWYKERPDSTGAFISSVYAALTPGKRKWTRIVVTGTAPTNALCAVVSVVPSTVVDTGQFYGALPQLEQKPYATTYCDGGLGTGYNWDFTANMFSAAASSFEDGSTGGWIAEGSGVTLSNNGALNYPGAGIHSLHVVCATSGIDRGCSSPALNVVAGQVYTCIVRVLPTTNFTARLTAFNATNGILGVTNADVLCAAGEWTTLHITFTALFTETFSLYVDTGSIAQTVTFDIDAITCKAEGFYTPWNNTVYFGPSNRTGAYLAYNNPCSLYGDRTVAVWARFMNTGTAGQVLAAIVPNSGGPTAGNAGLVLEVGQLSNFVDQSTAGFSPVAGDLALFVAVQNGSTGALSYYYAVNGGAYSVWNSASGSVPGPVGSGGSYLNIASFLATAQPSASLEQFCIWSRAFAPADVTALATAIAPVTMAADPTLEFAAFTAENPDTLLALTTSQTGFWRTFRSTIALSEQIDTDDFTYDSVSGLATTKFVVPQGSGFGIGDIVEYNGGVRQQVLAIIESTDDILFCAAA